MATSSWFTGGTPVGDQSQWSPSISSASRTAKSLSTGMSCRRKCPPPQLPAAIRCSRLPERSEESDFMEKTTQQRNKAIVLEAFDTLFNKRDYAKAETFWSPKYIQHSAHIEPGPDGLFTLVKNTPATLR